MEKKLIEAVKHHEILYNKRSFFYRKKKNRAAAWSEISKELNLPEDVCQTRWRYLRDKYVKQISESHHVSHSGTETMEGQWQYQSQMEFLRDHIRPRKSITSLSEESLLTELLEKNPSETSKTEDEKLIDAIKNHEILYNRSSLLYRKKRKRADAWSEISKELNLPEDVCQTRWRYLRDKYVKQISESHHVSGSGTETVEGQWQYQSQMEFVREHIRPRKSTISLSEESSPTEILEKTPSETSKTKDKKLIEAIKNHEILYNKSSPFYRKKQKRGAAWSEISKELNLPENVCQTRWKYLRDKYVKQFSESHHVSDSGTDTMGGQWQYHSQMEFLREHIRPPKTIARLSEESSPSEILEKKRSESVESMTEGLFSKMEFLEDPLSSNMSTASPFEAPSASKKRLRRESDTQVLNEFVSKMTSIAETRFSRIENDPHNGFFGMVREIFNKMEPEVVEDAKMNFLNYLHEQRKKN